MLAERLGEELEIPVFLYGELTAGERAGRAARAPSCAAAASAARRAARGARRRAAGAAAGFRPGADAPERGATLVAARPPLVAFNVELAPPATVDDARRIAALVREGGEHGLPGLRAIGVELRGGRGQVSMNVERPLELPLAEVVQGARRARAARRAPSSSGSRRRAALRGLPRRAAGAGLRSRPPPDRERIRLLSDGPDTTQATDQAPRQRRRRRRVARAHRAQADRRREERRRQGLGAPRANARVDRARPAADVEGRLLQGDGRDASCCCS